MAPPIAIIANCRDESWRCSPAAAGSAPRRLPDDGRALCHPDDPPEEFRGGTYWKSEIINQK
jgi:hypothetical protein